MTLILVALNGGDVQVNQWNWRPTVELLVRSRVVSREEAELLTVNGVGAAMGEDQSARAADAAEAILLALPDDGRLRLDGAITNDAAVEHSMPVDDDWYGASRAWLQTFVDFARGSGGFLVR